MFKLSSDLMETHQLLSPSALTCLDKDNQFTMVLENHGCGPVHLQSGQTLGHVEEVEIYQQERVQDCDGIGESQATVNTLLVETEYTAPEVAEDLDKQKRLIIMESLIIHKSNLSSE